MDTFLALLSNDPNGGSSYPGITPLNGTYGGIKCLVNGVMTVGCLPGLFTLLVNGLISFVGIAAVIMLIFSGIQMITASGDAKTLETAGKTFSYSLLGLVVALSAFLIVNIIAAVTGVHCLTGFGFACTK